MYTITESTQNIIWLVFFIWRNKEGRNHTSVQMASEPTTAHTGHDRWIILAASTPRGQAWRPNLTAYHKGSVDASFNLTRLVHKHQGSNGRFQKWYGVKNFTLGQIFILSFVTLGSPLNLLICKLRKVVCLLNSFLTLMPEALYERRHEYMPKVLNI